MEIAETNDLSEQSNDLTSIGGCRVHNYPHNRILDRFYEIAN